VPGGFVFGLGWELDGLASEAELDVAGAAMAVVEDGLEVFELGLGLEGEVGVFAGGDGVELEGPVFGFPRGGGDGRDGPVGEIEAGVEGFVAVVFLGDEFGVEVFGGGKFLDADVEK